ncbi:carbohydrate ABC transporter permease [Paenibacillus crassostreae]|uniref:Sugar ABC transporter permease n=1 Tax=Paenibacillus crassostreae TaxID=1763538 RepID=A0A162RHK2_9BACL|nr:carbohydrate ABC transporter permease [Paenibacillus crassostreae]AOZ93064.1 sugar ABC transporter permease [Paenibacillus crassostreae]OAB71847.1 sugar ABC transporter permease [Paenibacillus crassostreae]
MAKAKELKAYARFKSPGDRVFDTFNIIMMLLLVIVTLYPFINTLAVSLNQANDSLKGGIYLWPREWTLENYKYVLKESSIYQATFISAMRTIIGTVLSVLCCSMVAYTISRPEYVLRKFVSLAFILTMYFNGGLIPNFLLTRELGLIGTFSVYILPGLIGVFNVIVIRSFIEGLPEGILESARIDGAGEFTTFLRVVLPLCLPVIATVSLFTAVAQWNSWFDVFLYNSSYPELSTLQYELMKILQNSGASMNSQDYSSMFSTSNVANQVTPTSIRATMTIVASVPIIMVYPFLQKYFVQGMTIGGVKG